MAWWAVSIDVGADIENYSPDDPPLRFVDRSLPADCMRVAGGNHNLHQRSYGIRLSVDAEDAEGAIADMTEAPRRLGAS
jgi:hypothetical protein